MIKELFALAGKNPVLAPWLTPLQLLWPAIWRLALAACLFGAGWHYGAKHAEGNLAEDRIALLEAHLASVEALRDEERKVGEDYENAKSELERIRARIPVRSVRLCPEAAGDRVPVSGRAAGVSGAGTGSDVSGAAGRDIGPDLYALADHCDDLAARLTALQAWVKAMATTATR